jgi:hypothetical protein
MLKTHVLALFLVYFLAFRDSSVSHDHLHTEPLQVVSSDKHKAR